MASGGKDARPVTVQHHCEGCRRETRHKVLGITAHPRDPTKTLRILQCTECQSVEMIPGPSR